MPPFNGANHAPELQDDVLLGFTTLTSFPTVDLMLSENHLTGKASQSILGKQGSPTSNISPAYFTVLRPFSEGSCFRPVDQRNLGVGRKRIAFQALSRNAGGMRCGEYGGHVHNSCFPSDV